MNISQKTIFAPATPIGESSITVIRISGKDTFPILTKIFSKNANTFYAIDFTAVESHTAHHGYILKAILESSHELIDEVILTIFKEPNSFTGEDVAEISTHGGRFVFRKISSLLLGFGAEHAQPGEFSKRAFLNGKLDLTQAEAIADLISAKTELSFQAAQNQLNGRLSDKISELRTDLINYCSLVELELDFSEEGLEIVDKQLLTNNIDKLLNKIVELANSFESGKIIRSGINLTITGKPNVGKSSIFNHLLNDSRAIVSEIPGTTRDYIEEPLILGGFVFNLIDTAGIRKSKDILEKLGVEKSYRKLQDADLILNILDLTSNQQSLTESNGKATINVYNKADLISVLPDNKLCVSAKTGFNIDKLEEEIIAMAKELIKEDTISEVYITNERHRNLLLKSCEYLVNAKNLISENKGNELISLEIREALNTLNEIIGKTTNVDILNNIFSKFCIGK